MWIHSAISAIACVIKRLQSIRNEWLFIVIKGDLSAFFQKQVILEYMQDDFSINSKFEPTVELHMHLFVLFSVMAFLNLQNIFLSSIILSNI